MFITLLILVLALLGFEAIKLLQLKGNIAGYASYWKQYPTDGMFTYVVLGDSAAQGLGASKPEYGYVGIVASRIEQLTGKKVRIVNLSVTGARIKDVTANQLPQLKNYKPDLVTLEIGGNDVVHYNSANFKTEYDQLAALLPPNTVVSDIPYFGGRIRKNKEAVEASSYIKTSAEKYSLPLVHLQAETHNRDSLLNYSVDFFHPSNRGYRVWADAFWKTIQPLIKK